MDSQQVAAPIADWVDPRELHIDPYPAYARLRNESPVAWLPFLDMYVAANYEDCRVIEADIDRFSADRVTPTRRALGRASLIDTDDPQHAEMRRPINPGLRPRAIKERWTESFEANARHYLDILAEVGPDEADLNTLVASPLATKNLMDLLGLRGVEVDAVRNWSSTLMQGVANISDDAAVWADVEQARGEIDTLLADLIPYLRSHPDDTFTSALANSDLAIDVVAANVKLAISGGINEPQHAVTSIVWALSEHPDQRDAVLADPELWPDVFNETLRWLSPLSLVPRLVLDDTQLRGIHIPKGSTVTALLASANRDERVYINASTFDIFRPKVVNLAFGSGVHMCAGLWAARWSIGSIAVPMLYRRFQGLRTASDRESPWFGFVVRGLERHHVTWDKDLGSHATAAGGTS
jgi:cytochrome P450